jgi:hypothetical protein
MNDGIINKNIRVESLEAKMASTGNMKYIIKDEQGNKYFFWQKNKGEDSDVFLSFQGMAVKKGDTIAIGYTEKEDSFVNREGKTINYIDRFILGLREANGVPAASESQTAEKPRSEAPRALQSNSTDAFGRRLGIQGHINALLSNPNVLGGLEGLRNEDIVGVVRIAILIEDEAEKQLNPSALRQAVQKHAPSVVAPDIQEMAEDMERESAIDVEDIDY